jgi:hypothetical protein
MDSLGKEEGTARVNRRKKPPGDGLRRGWGGLVTVYSVLMTVYKWSVF